MNKKRHWFKLPAIAVWASPIGVFAALLAGGVGALGISHTCEECNHVTEITTGAFNATTVGFAVLGVVIGLVAMLYMVFAAKKENRIYYISATIGMVIMCMSSISLILGIMLVIIPLSVKGGSALWTISNPNYKKNSV